MKQKRELRDYLTAVRETPVFRNALIAEYDKHSPYVNKNEDDEYTLTSATTAIVYRGIESVAIARIGQAELDWFLSLPHTEIIGEAKDKYIADFDDVVWLTNGEQSYYNIYDKTPKVHKDEDGNDYEVTPPKLHGALASHKPSKMSMAASTFK